MTKILVILILLLPISANSQASPPPDYKMQADKIALKILGTDVNTDNLEPNPKQRIRSVIMKVLWNKVAEDNQIAPTNDEINKAGKFFNESISRELKEANINMPDLTMPPDMVSQIVMKWKVDKFLYDKYGGKVIFQQAGIEPIDAYTAYLKEQESSGAFKIHDADLKEAFWAYFTNPNHSFYPDKVGQEIMSKPMWEHDKKF